MGDKRFRKKFGFTLIAFAVATVALFIDKLTGGEWVTVTTVLAGVFGAADVADKRLNGELY